MQSVFLVMSILAYPFMAAAALLGACMAFVGFFDMRQVSHKRLLAALGATFVLMVICFSLASLVAIPGTRVNSATIISIVRPAWFVCSLFFFVTVLEMYWHIEAVRHK